MSRPFDKNIVEKIFACQAFLQTFCQKTGQQPVSGMAQPGRTQPQSGASIDATALTPPTASALRHSPQLPDLHPSAGAGGLGEVQLHAK
jgi:hypothetical protein